jgi:hypothetical protein
MWPRHTVHLIDSIIHHPNQCSDRSAIERSQEYAPDILQHIANDIVRLMLFILNGFDVNGYVGPATNKFGQRLRTGNNRLAMRFELLKKIACARQQLLKPSEHISP